MSHIPITCQTCGAQLNVAPDSQQVQCPFCHAEYAVKRSEGTIALRRLNGSGTPATPGAEASPQTAAAREARIAHLTEELVRYSSIFSDSVGKTTLMRIERNDFLIATAVMWIFSAASAVIPWLWLRMKPVRENYWILYLSLGLLGVSLLLSLITYLTDRRFQRLVFTVDQAQERRAEVQRELRQLKGLGQGIGRQ
jgi:hypothetical protein